MSSEAIYLLEAILKELQAIRIALKKLEKGS